VLIFAFTRGIVNSELRGIGRIVRYEGLLEAAAGALRRGGVRPDPRRDLLWALWLKHSATTREQPAAKCMNSQTQTRV